MSNMLSNSQFFAFFLVSVGLNACLIMYIHELGIENKKLTKKLKKEDLKYEKE